MGDDVCCYCWTQPTGPLPISRCATHLGQSSVVAKGGDHLAVWRVGDEADGSAHMSQSRPSDAVSSILHRLLACDHQVRGWNRNFMSCPRRAPGQREQDAT